MTLLGIGLLKLGIFSASPVGQTAFSCYIMQSLIWTTIFYGYGFGLFGRLQRYRLYYVVLGVCVVQLIVTPIWLRHFRFGRSSGSGARWRTWRSDRCACDPACRPNSRTSCERPMLAAP
jgi:uncharacterized membrane protein YeiB